MSHEFYTLFLNIILLHMKNYHRKKLYLVLLLKLLSLIYDSFGYYLKQYLEPFHISLGFILNISTLGCLQRNLKIVVLTCKICSDLSSNRTLY